jgi:alkylated DNA repair dioxygenase AlkB
MLQSISINDEKAQFSYKRNILSPHELRLLKFWLDNHDFKDGKCISGKEIPRQQIWFQEKEKYFCETWKYRYDRWTSEKYDQFLKFIQNKITDRAKDLYNIMNIDQPNINSCLINKYRDGTDSIRPHRDSPESFGETPTILVFSVGETRSLDFKQIIYNPSNMASLKQDQTSTHNFSYELEDNSLFIMSGASQKYFTHGIPKSDTNKQRYSLTLREYLYK